MAEQSIAVLRKRDGTEMSVTGAASCAHVRDDLGIFDMNVEVDLDETQAGVEPAGKKRKEDEVSKELVAAAVQMAVDNVMKRIESQRQSLIEEMNGSVERTAGAAMKVLTTDMHDRMLKWESPTSSQMQTQMQTEMQKHWNIFEKKWESSIVQLKLGAKDGTIS